MTHPRLSSTAIGVVLAVAALVCYTAFVLYGAWVDGTRQKIRKSGRRPVTDASGKVRAEDPEEVERSHREHGTDKEA